MVSAITSTFSHYTPSIPSVSSFMRNLARNVSKAAIPSILLFAAMTIQQADAGPVAYAACMAGCVAMPPVCAAGGWAACLAALAAPTP